MSSERIIIIGGGFAGVKCARVLRRRLQPQDGEIVLFNRENHMVFSPLLADVAGASLSPDSVAAPLRKMLPGLRCRTELVQKIDLRLSEVEYEAEDGRLKRMPYDYAVIACGSAVNLGMVPGMADHAFPLKSVGDALALRAHVMEQLEKAEVCEDPALRAWYLSFVVVGGGFSGVEVAGEINDLARGSTRYFRTFSRRDIKVTLVHSHEQILPEVTPRLRDFARSKMEKAGIEFVLNARVTLATKEGVGLKDGRMIRGATLVCTVGTTMPALLQLLDVPKEGGRLLTDPDMRLRGVANVWALGDCAQIINAWDGQPSPPTGQFAERQGRQAALNLLRVRRREPTRPFHFKPVGQLCSIGGYRGVAELFGLRMSGFLAWFTWRSVYLFKLPSWSQRIRVGFDWGWELLFSRDLAFLKPDTTQRISRGYYQPGDYIVRRGDPAASFYAIERGEVEVLGGAEAQPESLLAVLGPGDFFGEMALLSDRPRSADVRARTAVEVVIMGREVFTQITGSLAPLRKILGEAVKRRSGNLWLNLPTARAVLSREPLASFLEPAPPVRLSPESTLEEAVERFSERGLQFCCLLDQQERLCGILTRHHFLRAIELMATLPVSQRSGIRIKEVAAPDVVWVAAGDSSLTAASTMLDHDLPAIPVVNSRDDLRVCGLVRAERLTFRILQKLEAEGRG